MTTKNPNNSDNGRQDISELLSAAEQGDTDAQVELAFCFAKGIGCQPDEKQAFRWYQEAARRDNLQAQFELANCHEFGRGTECNSTKAARWYRKAADQGHAEAQCMLGNLTMGGYGVQKDLEEAARLFRLAIANGSEEARKRLVICEYKIRIEAEFRARRTFLPCPRDPGAKGLEDGFGYYSPRDYGKPRSPEWVENHPTPWTGQKPDNEQLGPLEDGGAAKMTIDGDLWTRVPIEVTWSLAESDANAYVTCYKSTPQPSPRCIHTEFTFQGHTIHIDYQRRVSFGPLSGFEEFKFFLDGKFYSRGGGFVCYGVWPHAWPAALRTPEFAIICNRFFGSGILPEFKHLTAWLITRKKP
ncbi:MAG TPA: tetratricopeptide repeat protein [Candidatus Ozemobacteraceae bacterium]|nr:tetratricopeptide repeat protein [Candidatus Ozemobacteraceae bacterium]